jgi:hypothetical protein
MEQTSGKVVQVEGNQSIELAVDEIVKLVRKKLIQVCDNRTPELESLSYQWAASKIKRQHIVEFRFKILLK